MRRWKCRFVALPRRLFGSVEDGGGEVAGGVFQRQHLQRRPHLRHFAHFGDVEGGDAHAAARLADRQALRLQPAECLAHRHMTRLEFLGDVILPQAGAGREFAAHDAVGQHAADPSCDCVFDVLAHLSLSPAGIAVPKLERRSRQGKCGRSRQSRPQGASQPCALPVEIGAAIV